MSSSNRYDVTVVGAGIVGLATADAIVRNYRAKVVVVETEPRVAAHQTGNNSGVIHSGLYYRPGSHKARNCTAGRELLYRFCERHGLPHERCGKVVVATTDAEATRLVELEARGRANGLQGLTRITQERLREIEPHARCVAALHVPETGIVDFVRVAERLAEEIGRRGGEVRTSSRTTAVRREGDRFRVETAAGELSSRYLINCAGLHSDRVARMCGVRPGVRIVPFRGEYHKLVCGREHLVRHLIYPVPDPQFPFLGVHFTRMIHGGVEVGPNALLAWKREGYRRAGFSLRDTLEIVGYGGFWRLAARYGRFGAGELRRSYSRSALARQLAEMVPEIRAADLAPGGSGVRAQAVAPDGALIDDFHIVDAERMLHVLNAPSPAATACLSIGASLARRAGERFDLARRETG